MGKEAASAFGRWFVLKNFPVKAELTAVCDIQTSELEWYRQIPSVSMLTTDYKELLANPDVDAVYIAVPHNLHKKYYIEILEAGKDLLGEKPFGIDLASAIAIQDAARKTNRFVRCSSEMPFLPGPQQVIREVTSPGFGPIIEINAGFHHSSDMDPLKPINWKRLSKFCGDIGVMGDLGMHVLHIPLRLGWLPTSVFAQLQKIVTRRPDGKGGWAECDTWNNASLYTSVPANDESIPMRLEMKRLSPGDTNSWYIEILGTQNGIRYSTKDTKALWKFTPGKQQSWHRIDLGFETAFPTITGGIFEPGFPDCFLQMFASFVAEREGLLHDRFGCVLPSEAVCAHRIFAAALESHIQQTLQYTS
jgi:predicted dehydrogenase